MTHLFLGWCEVKSPFRISSSGSTEEIGNENEAEDETESETDWTR